MTGFQTPCINVSDKLHPCMSFYMTTSCILFINNNISEVTWPFESRWKYIHSILSFVNINPHN
jgi:hypothetical protein